MSLQDLHQPDWDFYAKHKEEIDRKARDTLEKGTLQDIGHPPGPTLEIAAKAIWTILTKHPELGREDLTGDDGRKPLTGSEKRRQRRFDRERAPDNIIEIKPVEGKDYKVILKEDYVPPEPMTYVKNGKEMPKDWQPITFQGQSQPSKT